jgi:hypothetical protein
VVGRRVGSVAVWLQLLGGDGVSRGGRCLSWDEWTRWLDELDAL